MIFFGKLAIAALLGTLVGTERVAAGKSAGTRTFALVSMGSCLFVLLGTVVNAGHLGIVNFDPMRTAAAVIMGVGFIGGGLIFLKEGNLQGLTTAAGLWVSAGIGMAVGFGMYMIAVFASAITLFIFTFMWVIEDRMRHFFEKMQPVRVGRMVDTDEDSIPDSVEKLPPTRSEA